MSRRRRLSDTTPDRAGGLTPFQPAGARWLELPRRVRWSGLPRPYDLADRRDRILVYEQVMTEGTEDDVRRFIDVEEVLSL